MHEKTCQDVKLALYDDTTRQMFVLDPQEPAVGHLGDSVTVSGTSRAIRFTSRRSKMHTAIGLAVGQKAPAFSARDQFGQEQSLEYAERTERHSAPLFSFGRLVTVLQRAAGRAAKRKSAI